MTTREEVLNVLDTIIDPCSVPAGAPAGLAELGVVREVSVSGEPGSESVHVVLCVTEPGCVMGGPFAQETRQRVSALPGVREVTIAFDTDFLWSPEDMAPSYATRLREVRRQREEHYRELGRKISLLPIVEVRTRGAAQSAASPR